MALPRAHRRTRPTPNERTARRLEWTAIAFLGLNAIISVAHTDLRVTGIMDGAALFAAMLGVLALPMLVVSAAKTGRVRQETKRVAAELDRRIAIDAYERLAVERTRERVAAMVSPGSSMEMHYQPIIDLSTNRTVGHEALARFPDGAPDEWFAAAEKVGLGTELEIAAIRRALDGVNHLHGYVSINASPETLLSEEFWDAVSTVDGHRLVLELTEHVHVDEYRHYEAALMRLRRSGIRLAIDDAGAGHSSMRHIIHMAPEIIKLDRSLTSMVDIDPIRKSLVAALVTFALAIEATVIAEGIERIEEAAALTTMGVACGQGWLYARAMPLMQAEKHVLVDLRCGNTETIAASPAF